VPILARKILMNNQNIQGFKEVHSSDCS
jgi:hypothetical protein